ncbi:hypothetical protein CRENPOLYSF1_230015 [Crenothrix polyspora]|uniref:Uncharacterized protein n=1 Tax=Crenothrix polyspora TaxID=360316 RepID=A0A1R4H6S9_9GAMM|nr:hypothetical protein CRENPOLYSF1_230015 [Crenothrix polyspora]
MGALFRWDFLRHPNLQICIYSAYTPSPLFRQKYQIPVIKKSSAPIISFL